MKIKQFKVFNENVENVQFTESSLSFHDLVTEKMKSTTGYVVVSYSQDDHYAWVYSYPNIEECRKHFKVNNGWVVPTDEFMDEFSVNENECYLFIDGKNANG